MLQGIAATLLARGRTWLFTFSLLACGLIPRFLRYCFARALSFQLKEFAKEIGNIPSDRLLKTVLFISVRLHSREPRLAAAARLAGWDPWLVYCGRANLDLDENFLRATRVENRFQLVMAMWLFRGPLIHLFAPSGHEAYFLVRIKHRPVVIDLYDTCSGITQIPQRRKRNERKAMELADGMTHRDLRGKYLKRLHGYKLPRFNIFIHDLLPESPRHSPDQSRWPEIRVASVGWIDDKENSILRTAIALGEARIHVHVLFNPFQSNSECYLRLQQSSEYFHIERSVTGTAFREQLARYDFGLAIFERHLFQEACAAYSEDYILACGSSRLMDYVHAGLGVIISPTLRFQHFFARRYAPVVVHASRDFLKNPRPFLEAALREKAQARPRDCSAVTVRGVATRLGEFYSRLSSVEPVDDGSSAAATRGETREFCGNNDEVIHSPFSRR